jgi:hypothetical protein
MVTQSQYASISLTDMDNAPIRNRNQFQNNKVLNCLVALLLLTNITFFTFVIYGFLQTKTEVQADLSIYSKAVTDQVDIIINEFNIVNAYADSIDETLKEIEVDFHELNTEISEIEDIILAILNILLNQESKS